jgi:uncharacterized protein YbjT (DUF2867 family)
MTQRVLVAGATGAVGSLVVKQLAERGIAVRVLCRQGAQAQKLKHYTSDVVLGDALLDGSLRNACDGVSAVISCLGATVGLKSPEKRSFRQVDPVANGHLLHEAERAGTSRFVYLSVFIEPGYAHTDYILAHEEFVTRLRASKVSSGVVRPTGIFTALTELVEMAKKGLAIVIGDGQARSNPIHPEDVAAACIRALEPGIDELPVGGPQVLTRAEVSLLAAQAVGKTVALRHIPPWTMLAASACTKPFNRRLGELLEFGTRVATTNAVAPAVGTRTIEEFFNAHAQTLE